MKLHCHGGDCCGVKQIFKMGYPDRETVALEEKQPLACSENLSFNTEKGRFFHPAAPRETNLVRLDRYLAFLDETRPKGVTEIVLADKMGGPLWTDYYKLWEKHLLDRHFRLVNQSVNSNTQNNLYVYHRNSGEVPKAVFDDGEKKKDKGEKPLAERVTEACPVDVPVPPPASRIARRPRVRGYVDNYCGDPTCHLCRNNNVIPENTDEA